MTIWKVVYKNGDGEVGCSGSTEVYLYDSGVTTTTTTPAPTIEKVARTAGIITDTSYDFTLPTASTGDIMVLFVIFAPNSPASITQPTGWTLIAEHENDATYPNLCMYYRVKQASDTIVTIVSSGTFSKNVECTSFTNCTTVASNSTFYTGTGTSLSLSRTGVISNSLIFGVIGLSATSATITQTVGWTVNGYLEGSSFQYKAVYQIDTDGGTSPTLNYTFTSGNYTGFIFEIKE